MWCEMLNFFDQEKLINGMEYVIDTLGVPATIHFVNRPVNTPPLAVNVGFKSISWKDEELVNAFGIGAKIITVKAREVMQLLKFDVIKIADEEYTIDSVFPVHVNGTVIFHKCVVKGK